MKKVIKNVTVAVITLMLMLLSIYVSGCDSNTYIIKKHKTGYKIVVSETCNTQEQLAGEELSYFLKEATGVTVPIIKDSDIESLEQNENKYFIIGENKFSTQKKLLNELSGYKSHACMIKTVGNTVYIIGPTSKGTLNGVYDYLEKILNYDCFDVDCFYIDKVDELLLKNLNYKHNPSINSLQPFLEAINAQPLASARMKAITEANSFIWYGEGWCHTCEALLPKSEAKAHPTWFSSDCTQWCWSTALEDEEMFNYIYNNFKAKITEKDAEFASISQNDVQTWCTCNKCLQSAIKYGSNLAVCIKLCNKVSDRLKQDYPGLKVKIHTFSYHMTSSALTFIDDEVICRDNVSVMFAPIRSNYTTDFYDEANKSAKLSMEALHEVCDRLSIWTYNQHFPEYFVVYNSFNGYSERVRQMSENGVEYWFDQLAGKNNQGFELLKVYLDCKLAWDCSLNTDDLIKKFISNYYGEGAPYVQQFIDDYRIESLIAYSNGMQTDINGSNFISTNFWTKGAILKWMNFFDNAFEAIEHLKTEDMDLYNKYYLRLARERLVPLYLLISIYGDTFTFTDISAYKALFKNDCSLVAVVQSGEGKSINDLYTKWGIQ